MELTGPNVAMNLCMYLHGLYAPVCMFVSVLLVQSEPSKKAIPEPQPVFLTFRYFA